MTGKFGLKNLKITKFGNPIFWIPRFIAPSHNAELNRNKDLKNTQKK